MTTPEDTPQDFDMATLDVAIASMTPGQRQAELRLTDQVAIGLTAFDIGEDHFGRGDLTSARRWLRIAARYDAPGAEQLLTDVDVLINAVRTPQIEQTTAGTALETDPDATEVERTDIATTLVDAAAILRVAEQVLHQAREQAKRLIDEASTRADRIERDARRAAEKIAPPVMEFGAELRRLREARGISLTRLSKSIFRNKGYLSKVENGLSQPNRVLAALCDNALDTGGHLEVLLDSTANSQIVISGMVTAAPTKPLAGSELLEWAKCGIGSGVTGAHCDDQAVVNFENALDTWQSMSGTVDPAQMLPGVLASLVGLRQLAAIAPSFDLMHLASRYARLTASLYQAAGDITRAQRWSATATRLTERANAHLSSHEPTSSHPLSTNHYRINRQSQESNHDAWLAELLQQRQDKPKDMTGAMDMFVAPRREKILAGPQLREALTELSKREPEAIPQSA